MLSLHGDLLQFWRIIYVVIIELHCDCCGVAGYGTFLAIVPSGASTGIYEALELRDGGSRYKGVAVWQGHWKILCEWMWCILNHFDAIIYYISIYHFNKPGKVGRTCPRFWWTNPHFFVQTFPRRLQAWSILDLRRDLVTCRWEELGLPRRWRTLTAPLRALSQILRHFVHFVILPILAEHREHLELARCCVRNRHCLLIRLHSVFCFPARLGAQPGSAHEVLNKVQMVQNSSPLRSTWFGRFGSTFRPEAKVEGQRRPTQKGARWLHGLAAQMRGPRFCDPWRMSISDLGSQKCRCSVAHQDVLPTCSVQLVPQEAFTLTSFAFRHDDRVPSQVQKLDGTQNEWGYPKAQNLHPSGCLPLEKSPFSKHILKYQGDVSWFRWNGFCMTVCSHHCTFLFCIFCCLLMFVVCSIPSKHLRLYHSPVSAGQTGSHGFTSLTNRFKNWCRKYRLVFKLFP